jgi:hypothetical protein
LPFCAFLLSFVEAPAPNVAGFTREKHRFLVRLLLATKKATTFPGGRYYIRPGFLKFDSKVVKLLSSFRREPHPGRCAVSQRSADVFGCVRHDRSSSFVLLPPSTQDYGVNTANVLRRFGRSSDKILKSIWRPSQVKA